jgi:hypothetical protein
MKVTGIFATVALFAGVFASTNVTTASNDTAFNVTSLNGTCKYFFFLKKKCGL